MLHVTDLRTVNGLCVSFDVAQGACLALSGPSGSGKSLVLRGITDLDPAPGRVRLNDLDRDALPAPAWRRRVRYVAAEPQFWHDRLEDAIGQPADLLGLTPAHLRAPIAQLSSGQRQRGALLRALADAPDVLLLDEPCAALDPAATALIEARLRQEMTRGAHVILVTHDAAQAERLAQTRYDLEAAP